MATKFTMVPSVIGSQMLPLLREVRPQTVSLAISLLVLHIALLQRQRQLTAWKAIFQTPLLIQSPRRQIPLKT